MTSNDRQSNPLEYSIPAQTRSPQAPWWIAWPAILLGIAYVLLHGVKINNRTEDAKRAAAKQDISAFETVMGDFKQDVGRYPSTAEGLAALTQRQPNLPSWRGPYLAKPAVYDPWAHPNVYQFPGRHNPKGFDLYSAGPNGVKGDTDDIGNW